MSKTSRELISIAAKYEASITAWEDGDDVITDITMPSCDAELTVSQNDNGCEAALLVSLVNGDEPLLIDFTTCMAIAEKLEQVKKLMEELESAGLTA